MKHQSDEGNFIATIGAHTRVPAQFESEAIWH
jgi:hypothetical protein